MKTYRHILAVTSVVCALVVLSGCLKSKNVPASDGPINVDRLVGERVKINTKYPAKP